MYYITKNLCLCRQLRPALMRARVLEVVRHLLALLALLVQKYKC